MVIKLFFIAIITVVITSVLKNTAKEFVLPFQLITGFVLLSYILSESAEPLSRFQDMLEKYSELTSVIESLLKAGIICIITKLSTDICRENGNYFVENIVELGGRSMIFIISIPYIFRIIETAVAFVD